jgi:hypothetical protein
MREWQKLVSVLLDALGDEVAAVGAPAWFFVEGEPSDEGPEAFSLGLGWDPTPLLGGLAPPEWRAVGLVATAKAFVPTRSMRNGCRASGQPMGSLRIACLVTREDAIYSKAVTSEGEVIDDPPEEGLLIGELRLCLGLPVNPLNVG